MSELVGEEDERVAVQVDGKAGLVGGAGEWCWLEPEQPQEEM